MVSLFLAGILSGIILGRAFKIYILFPAYSVAFILMLAMIHFAGQGLWQAATETIILIIGLQLGYIMGLISTDLSVVTRFLRRVRRRETPAARSRSIHP